LANRQQTLLMSFDCISWIQVSTAAGDVLPDSYPGRQAPKTISSQEAAGVNRVDSIALVLWLINCRPWAKCRPNVSDGGSTSLISVMVATCSQAIGTVLKCGTDGWSGSTKPANCAIPSRIVKAIFDSLRVLVSPSYRTVRATAEWGVPWSSKETSTPQRRIVNDVESCLFPLVNTTILLITFVTHSYACGVHCWVVAGNFPNSFRFLNRCCCCL